MLTLCVSYTADMENSIPGNVGTRPKLNEPVIHDHRHNLQNRFELKRTLGEGTYGKVKLAVEKFTGEPVAIKYIKKSKIHDNYDMNRIQREIKILSTLHHPQIVSVYEVFENKDKIIVVMEFADGGELFDYINNNQLSEKDARKIFRQIVSAINHCHQNGIVHRDLKLENILLDSKNNVKIADFGLSNFYDYSNFLQTYCGSPLYASPEIVNGQPYYGPEVDCWSLGVVLYTLVYGTMPFDGSNFKKLQTQILTGDYYEPDKPSEAAGLIQHLLTVNPAKRAKMADIISHWWVNLGYSIMPDNEPYSAQQQVTRYLSQLLSSSSESDEGDSENGNKIKTVQPLKGILKKPKMSDSHQGQLRGSDVPKFTDTLNETVNCQLVSECKSHANEYFVPVSPADKPGTNSEGTYYQPSALSQPQNDIAIIEGYIDKKVFDSSIVPKRGILKHQGKFSTEDSGCELNDPSRKDLNCFSLYQTDLSEADSAIDSPDGLVNNHASSVGDNVQRGDNFQPSDNVKSGTFSFASYEISLTTDSMNEMSYLNAAVIPHKRGILKYTSKDSYKRLSACSTGSNSSADFLDFSYDSSEALNTMRICKNSTSAKVCSRYNGADLEQQMWEESQLFAFDYSAAQNVCD